MILFAFIEKHLVGGLTAGRSSRPRVSPATARAQHRPQPEVVVHHEDVGLLPGRERPDTGEAEGPRGGAATRP